MSKPTYTDLLDRIADDAARIRELEAALYGAAESLLTFRPPHDPENMPYWTQLDEVTLHTARDLCGKYPQSETEEKHGT